MKQIIILSGPPCSGKTTYIEEHFSQNIVISSDKEFINIPESQCSLFEKNIQALEISYKKLSDFCSQSVSPIVFDSTNLTFERRESVYQIAKKYDYEMMTVFLDVDFSKVFRNWTKRGRDIKIETLLFLYCIFDTKKHLFGEYLFIKKNSRKKYHQLEKFLHGQEFSRSLLFSENPDIKVLSDIWKKGGKDFFCEYQKKLQYFEEISLEEKFALFYSEVKYFYIDYIINKKLTYSHTYDAFLSGFFQNIMKKKLENMGFESQNTFDIFQKCTNSF